MTYEYQQYLAHHGIKGQKWGVRQWQNEDGTFTEAGKHRYGWGFGRQSQPSAPGNANRQARSSSGPVNARQGARSSNSRAAKPSKAEMERRRERRKKIMMAAGAIAVAGLAAYSIQRSNKTRQNMIQMAKNRVHGNYETAAKAAKTSSDLMKTRSWQSRDVDAIRSMSDARRALGLKTRKDARRYIKDNGLAKRRTADIIEQRTGKLIEGYRKTATGKWKPIAGRRLRKARDLAARRFYV